MTTESHDNPGADKPVALGSTDGLGAAAALAFGVGPFHVEARTNACADVCDSRGRAVATCSWAPELAKQRADILCKMLNAATGAAPNAGGKL